MGREVPGTPRLRFSLTSLRVPPCKPSLRGVATCDPSAQLPTILEYAVKIQLGRLEIWAPQTTLVFYLNKKCRGRVTDSLLSILRLTICFSCFFLDLLAESVACHTQMHGVTGAMC